MSNRQNTYLKAMGIDVWLERSPSNTSSQETSQPEASHHVETNVKQAEPELIPAAKTESIVAPDNKVNIDQLDWSALHSSVVECHDCDLSKNRTKTIFGAGNQTAALMIIGDAPSAEDELQGEPFSGQAGKLLTAMLKAMGYQRNDVYISNLVKCRTSENQEPGIEEVAACESYLVRQIKLVQPDLILVLGSVAAQRLLKSKSTLSRLRGQLHYIENINIPVIVSFDPAYLLRSPNEKRKAWDDLQTAMKELTNIAASKK
ncbi:MAG: uracil-DNA glycosylase [Gammaproteobacteria bacterium]|nr:uracil-DNA glycosylase [Gammaproteobacteria bacterium]